MARKTPNRPDLSAESRIPFDYIKSGQFRVLHVDGAIGGITPSGGIHIGLYSERQAFPQRQVISLSKDGILGGVIESETISRNSIVRELEVDAVMSVAAARSLLTWLEDRLREYDAIDAAHTAAATKEK